MTLEEVSNHIKQAAEAQHIEVYYAHRDVLLAHDAEQREEIVRLRTLCLEAYQVVGSLATDAGMFDHQATVRVLDNLSMAGTGKPLPHSELLPYPASQKIARLREALKDAMDLIDVDNLTTQTVYRNCQRALKESSK